jgi:hypothetical protein
VKDLYKNYKSLKKLKISEDGKVFHIPGWAESIL